MKVICKGHKICGFRNECIHSKSHDKIEECKIEQYGSPNCECSHKYLRKEKLQKLCK